MRLITTALAAAALLSAVVTANAHDYEVGNVEIGHPWSRATLPNAPVAGGYMTITNTGTSADRLIGGATPAAASLTRKPPPGKPPYWARIAATYSRIVASNFEGMRRRQPSGSPPCPSASIT